MKLNSGLLPEDYYLIRIKESGPLLEINEYTKTIWMDKLERLTLARKIVLDPKLYQFVLFSGDDENIEGIANKFDNSEFVVEKVEVEMT